MLELVAELASKVTKEVTADLIRSFREEMIAQGINEDWAEDIVLGAVENFTKRAKANGRRRMKTPKQHKRTVSKRRRQVAA